MSKKEINVYYKGSVQKIKYYGSLDEESLKKTIKQIFKIEEPLSQIYFQDEDGDIIILNDQIPSGLSVHVFVEPDSIPKNPSKELNVENKNGLLKFHWILEKSNPSDLKVIVDKYLYTTVDDDDHHPQARSSCTFEKGIHFFVLRKPVLSAYSFLFICDEDRTYKRSDESSYPNTIGICNGCPRDENFYNDNYTINLGILVDMEHKKCVFYDYDKRIKRKIFFMKNNEAEEGYEAPIGFEKAKLLAWLKRDACNGDGRRIGITILNEGCIPIPNWV